MASEQQGTVLEAAQRYYRAVERGDREQVEALSVEALRVEGWFDDEWCVWDRHAYLDRVGRFAQILGENPVAKVRSIAGDDRHGVVEGDIRWSGGTFRDILLFARSSLGWRLHHKTFRSVPRSDEPLELYGAVGPNTMKVAIALEELGLPYRIRTVNLDEGEQFRAPVATLNPNHKVPVLVDASENRVLFESNAILLYLAEKAGALVPLRSQLRDELLQWLFFQSASIGPMLGQRGHFELFASERLPYAIARYQKESERLFDVLDRRLRGRTFLLDEYSIADIACFAWLFCVRAFGFRFESKRPSLTEWFQRLRDREAVRRGVDVPAPFFRPQPDADDRTSSSP